MYSLLYKTSLFVAVATLLATSMLTAFAYEYSPPTHILLYPVFLYDVLGLHVGVIYTGCTIVSFVLLILVAAYKQGATRRHIAIAILFVNIFLLLALLFRVYDLFGFFYTLQEKLHPSLFVPHVGGILIALSQSLFTIFALAALHKRD